MISGPQEPQYSRLGMGGIQYRCDRAQRLNITVVHGDVTVAQLQDFASRQDTDRKWHAATRSLTDLRTTRAPEITVDALGVLAALYTNMRADDPWMRAAIVADAAYEFGSQYGAVRDSGWSSTNAFTALEPACAWLDADIAEVSATIEALHAEIAKSDTGGTARP